MKKKQFILKSFLTLFILVVSFFVSNQVSASTTIVDLPMTGSTVLVPAHGNDSIMFCTYKQDRSYNDLVDDSGTFASLFYQVDSGYNKMTVYYQINPSAGYHVLTGGYYSAFSCFFVDGVNTTSFLNTWSSAWGSQGWTADASFTYNAVNEDSLVLGFGHTHLNYWSGITSMYGTGSTTVINYFQAYYAGDSQSFYQFSNSSKALTFNLHGSTSAGPQEWLDTNRAMFVELDTNVTPPSFDYVQYNYSQGQAEIIGAYPTLEPLNWWIHYNVCDTGYVAGGNIEFYITDDSGNRENTINGGKKLHSDSFIGPWNCQGDFLYTGQADSGTYGTSTMKISMDVTDASSTVIETIDSPSFTVTQLPHIIYSNGNINYGGINPLSIDLSYSTTTPITFDYNICHSENWASSTFWLWNESTGGNTEYSVVPTACSGFAIINFDHGTSTSFLYDWFAQIRLEDSALNTQIISNDFEIDMLTSIIPDATPLSVQSLFGTSTSALACTPDEWEEATNSTTPWYSHNFFNLTRLKCNTSLTIYNTLDNFIRSFVLIFDNSIAKIRYLFPLNIPTKILESWNRSASTPLTSDLELLNVAEPDGSIKGYMPREWISSSTDLTPVIFSQNFMSNGNANFNALMPKIRNLTGWFQWILFALGLMLWAKSIYAELKGYDHSDTDVYHTQSKNKKYRL